MVLNKKHILEIFVSVVMLILFLTACNSESSKPSAPTLKLITVSPATTAVVKSSIGYLYATGTYTDNSTKDLTTTVKWSSSNTSVATVGLNTGVVTPASMSSNGQTAVITATSGTGSAALTATSTISISSPATLLSIAVTPQNPSVAIYSTVPLIATGTYSDGSPQDLTTTVIWTSDNTVVAKVGIKTGLVTPAPGATASQTAIITATSGGLKASSTITVLAAAATATTTTFDLNTVSDPLARQQWGLLNTGQSGYADTPGVANTGGLLGTDINVNPVYVADGYTGKGIIVAVVDSGMEIAHEDLSANVVTGGSWNFINNTTDPTNTTATTGDHGTMVSGIVAMARNGIGGLGVAPNAQLKGFNFLRDSTTQNLSNALASLGGSSINPASTDVSIFNQSFGTSNPGNLFVDATVENQYSSGTSTLRSAKGALYVKSAGNGFGRFYTQVIDTITYETDGCDLTDGGNSIGISCQNANFDPYNTLPYNIVVAALNAKGTKSSYSTAGSAIWASAPGGEIGNNVAAMKALGVASGLVTGYDPAIVTTDQSGCSIGASRNPPVAGLVANGGPYSYFNQGGTQLSSINLNCNYTNKMNGTSSAAPMMTGSIALILEANPGLNWREVKDILARSAVHVDTTRASVSVPLGDGNYIAERGWVTNAAGLQFHNWYGFGAVNVKAAVDLAKGYSLGSLGFFANTGWVDSGGVILAVPDNSVTGVTQELSVGKVGASGIVEAVQIQITTTAIGGYAGDLGIEVTSPSSTISILKNIRDGFSGGAVSRNSSTGAITYLGGTLSGMVLASNAFYGESSTGLWKIKVVDGWSGHGIQTLTNAKIRIYGH